MGERNGTVPTEQALRVWYRGIWASQGLVENNKDKVSGVVD